MLHRLVALAGQQQQHQQQHVLMPLLQQLQQQHTLVQQQQQCRNLSWTLASSSSISMPSSVHTLWHSLQLAQHYSQRASKLNPKERKAQNKTDKKALKKSAVPQSAASAGDSATSFEEDMNKVEPDVTRLVLQAIHNITPTLDVRTIRSATTVKYVPGLMPPKKARSLALHWLITAADARKKSSGASYAECLALELLLAYQKRGGARQKRDDLHKLALQNRANVHLRWW